ncbi:hypothetical protein CVT26_004339 [Gymnopilus dilepis]|uniref:Uncharacterized protein n=1 Tax=Gymnopilus dilepis TaxID=231916 RepID=A0A409W2A9_9AGAR|nr:hypothetical protein CVT26_004339 [Gymnopilus dilepis]
MSYQVIDSLSYYTDKYWEEFNTEQIASTASDWLIFIDSKDTSITARFKIPTQPTTGDFCPTAFIGDTVQEIWEWFDKNIARADNDEFMQACFFILDEQTVEGETCLFIETRDATYHFLRCHFDVAMQCAITCYTGKTIEETTMGAFMRSGEVMAKARQTLVENGGLYIEGGEVKVDEYWRYLGEDSEESENS